MCVPAVALLFDRCGCFLYSLLTSSSACSAKSLYGVFHIQGPYRELDSPPPPPVHPLFRIISNAFWGFIGTDVSFVSLALFVLFILRFRWTVSCYPSCVLMQCSQHIQNPISLTYVIHKWMIPFYRCFGMNLFPSDPLEFTSL